MYRDAYPSHKNTVEISVVQIILIAVILTVTFVIPATLMNNYREQQRQQIYSQQVINAREYQTGGQVAGVSTSANTTVHVPVLNLDLNLNSETGVLLTGGLLLGGIACIITIYLLISPRKRH